MAGRGMPVAHPGQGPVPMVSLLGNPQAQMPMGPRPMMPGVPAMGMKPEGYIPGQLGVMVTQTPQGHVMAHVPHPHMHHPHPMVAASYASPARGPAVMQHHNTVNAQNPAARAPFVTEWLLSNYEPGEGVSMPRSSLYEHYSQFCSQSHIEPMNAASFGKLLRSIFPNLKTRRLGTRGNSKYHYYGVRLKATSQLRINPSPGVDEAGGMSDEGSGDESDAPMAAPQGAPNGAGAAPADAQRPSPGAALGASGKVTLPEFPKPDAALLPAGVTAEQAQTFLVMYRTHCQRVLDTVYRTHFNEVEGLLAYFWNGIPAHFRELLACSEVIELIAECDNILYEMTLQILLPNVLQPMPVSLTQAIRHFAKHLEGWLVKALSEAPPALLKRKVEVSRTFSQSLRRHTSLNHLAQAARAVLQNASQSQQMHNDWARIDFDSIRDQAQWVSLCDGDLLRSIEGDFKKFLQQRYTLEDWTVWLKGIVSKCLDTAKDPKTHEEAARQFLLRWSFFSSLVIRDLTLRSATSFGSFHLIRLLYDEYIFHLIERRRHRLARLSNKYCTIKEDSPDGGDLVIVRKRSRDDEEEGGVKQEPNGGSGSSEPASAEEPATKKARGD